MLYEIKRNVYADWSLAVFVLARANRCVLNLVKTNILKQVHPPTFALGFALICSEVLPEVYSTVDILYFLNQTACDILWVLLGLLWIMLVRTNSNHSIAAKRRHNLL